MRTARVDWQLVGWVERSDTHHPCGRSQGDRLYCTMEQVETILNVFMVRDGLFARGGGET